MLIGLLFPAMSFILTFLVSASSAVIPILIGTRYGLHSMDVWPSNTIKGLIFPAIAYGAVEGVGITLAIALSAGLVLLTTSSDTMQLTETAEFSPQYLEPWFAVPFLAALLICFLAICAIRASLLVPIASASIGRDPDGMKYTPFRHFGASFWPLFGLVAISFIGMAIVLSGVLIAIFVTGAIDTLVAEAQELPGMISGINDIRPLWSLIGLAVLYVLIGLWSFSIQCAGGVLGYLQLGNGKSATKGPAQAQTPRQPTPPPVTKSGPKMTNEELRALRKSREFRD